MPLNGANSDQMEQRTRDLLEGRVAWPMYPKLPMKCRDGKTMQFGMISAPVDLGNIEIVMDGPVRVPFASVKRMLEAGWVAD